MKIFLTKLHYKKNLCRSENVLLKVLKFFCVFYFLAVKLRNFLYKKGILKSYKSSIYTISVGNLTTGGTGKTPVVAEIVNYLKHEKVAILSRGYGGKLPNKEPNLISENGEIFFDAAMAGDEPYFLAKKCSSASVITCASRIKGAKAAQKLGCTKLILDDGFGHLKLHRDLNILIIDSQKQFGNEFLLPAGPLREPLSEIMRADKILVVNKSANIAEAEVYAKFLSDRFKKPVFMCNMLKSRIYDINVPTFELKDKKIIAFSAIAQPEQFYEYLKKDFELIDTKNFEDHHLYTVADIEKLIDLAKKNGVSSVVTTEKDAVKVLDVLNLLKERNFGVGFFALELSTQLDVGELLKDAGTI